MIDLLNNGIQQNIGTPFNYTLTAVGELTPSSPTNWSYIAVTPGYGISGNTTSGSIIIPNATMDHLNPGRYDLYLMGTNQNNDIVALDQEQVNVGQPPAPVTSIPVLNVSVTSTSGGFLNADTIMLSNSTWNTTWSGRDYANVDNLALGTQYTVNVTKAGYVDVTGYVTVNGDNPRWVNVTLAQLGQSVYPGHGSIGERDGGFRDDPYLPGTDRRVGQHPGQQAQGAADVRHDDHRAMTVLALPWKSRCG